MYGATVTASAPSPSNMARAYRVAVLPMSPRFASAITKTSLGICSTTRSKAAHPAAPYCSKKAKLGLYATATCWVA